MKLSTLFYSLILMFSVGCVTKGARLTPGGSSVRMVTSTPVGCKYKGRITGFWRGVYWTGGEAVNNAGVELLNEAYDAGANTVEVLGSGLSGMDGAYATGETYLCDQ